ncbi:zinc ribbon domain-containing protein [Methanobrevibacter smithii]|uniref:zinc ribbon domain-containing protein n=1 Tax=Methanobrevibacter smithii TaxID=2173 RepID=UPI0037DC1DD4
MDEMVSDTILEFAKAFFENFNNSVEIQLKNQNEIVTATIDNIKAFQTDFVEISKMQLENSDAIKNNQRELVEMGNLQLENLDAIKNNQIELSNKFDILIEQNERLIDLLSDNTSQSQNICPECGNAIPVNSKFCIKCGAKF